MSGETWSSVPWQLVCDDGVLHKRRVPYVTGGTYLQTLDIWVPASSNDQTRQQGKGVPEITSGIPHRDGLWVVYIHGGAWRDPLVDSSSFESAALTLLGRTAPGDAAPIAGIASLNYRLSQHPNHPTHPSPPKDPAAPLDAARTAKHPDHIRDVLTGLSYLESVGALSNGYILAGHSCGAYLAFQVVMKQNRWGSDAPIKIRKPEIILGLNGLYNMSAFLDNPDSSHAQLVPIYDAFTNGAFGENKEQWFMTCPMVVEDWEAEWPESKKVVLAQSRTDELVPYSQTD